jgi:PPOX class probable F420-dependent enzyme
VDDRVRALLEGPNYVHVATLMPDGAPHSVAMWGGVEGDRVIIFTGSPESRKARNLADDGRVAISIVDHDNPYRTAQIRGHVVETRHGAVALDAMDRLSEKYTGEPFPWRTDQGTLYLIEVDWSRFAELPFTHRPGAAG